MCEDASFRDLTKPREGPIHQILGTSELQITVQPSMRRLCFPSYEKASGFVCGCWEFPKQSAAG